VPVYSSPLHPRIEAQLASSAAASGAQENPNVPVTTTSTAVPRAALAPAAATHPLTAVFEFLIRRRIVLSAILVVLLVGEDVISGERPHDPLNIHDRLGIAGGLLVVLGVALRSWAVGILRKDRELTVTGPYALIRNPLYVGSFLMMFGFCALIGDPMNYLLLPGPMLVMYWIKVRQEERLLATLFPRDWPSYARTIPRFFPWPRLTNLKADWRLAQWQRSREYHAVLASIAGLAAIKVWQLMI
jgi:protein-S-isoprenylcysteine O-methyltransferase Ste14